MNTAGAHSPRPPHRLRQAPRADPFAHPASPSPRQDFPHISEFPSGSGPRSPGPSNPTNSGDWDSSYPSGECGISPCRSVVTPATLGVE